MVDAEIREKFRKLYEKKYGIILSNEETTRMAIDLINLVKVLLKPESKSNKNISCEVERRTNETIRAEQFQ